MTSISSKEEVFIPLGIGEMQIKMAAVHTKPPCFLFSLMIVLGSWDLL